MEYHAGGSYHRNPILQLLLLRFLLRLLFQQAQPRIFPQQALLLLVFKDFRVIIESFYLISIVLIFLEEIVVIEIFQFLIRIEEFADQADASSYS